MRVNLWLRTATRVLVRTGQVRAPAFPELVRKAAALPWERFVRPGARASFHVACHKSRLYHSGGVRQRLHTALQERVGFDVPLGEDGQLFVARFDHDVCTVSADSSGPLLHARGWRGPQAMAPLRSPSAASLLLAARYYGSEPLCDPLCGSGTIPIEAAFIAQRRAPGLLREFAFQRWPEFDAAAFTKLREHARAQERPLSSPIEASDQDAGAAAAAKENAERAGVQIEVMQRRLAQFPPDRGAGPIACNPPYGVRVARGTAFRDLAQCLQRRPVRRPGLVVPDGAAAR